MCPQSAAARTNVQKLQMITRMTVFLLSTMATGSALCLYATINYTLREYSRNVVIGYSLSSVNINVYIY